MDGWAGRSIPDAHFVPVQRLSSARRPVVRPRIFPGGGIRARFELANTRDVQGYTALGGAMEDCRVQSLHLAIPGQPLAKAHFDKCGWMTLLPAKVRPFTAF